MPNREVQVGNSIEHCREPLSADPGKAMFTERLKNAVRFRLLRRARKREQSRFRDYCLNLPKLVSEPVFVKIGASDGITDDPCSDFLLANTSWRGLLIEPVPYCFDRLRANFQDSGRFCLEQVAIGAPTGECAFYYVDAKAIQNIPSLPVWFDQLGSFNRNHIMKHLDGVLDPFIIECKVQVCPLSDVLMRNEIQDVHLLHIDTEGHDYEVLKTLDFTKHAPLSIFVEHKHLPDVEKTELRKLLQEHGYSVGDCGEDYFAVNEKANRRLQGTARMRRRKTKAAKERPGQEG
jgi:FkbM family methyltransferase